MEDAGEGGRQCQDSRPAQQQVGRGGDGKATAGGVSGYATLGAIVSLHQPRFCRQVRYQTARASLHASIEAPIRMHERRISRTISENCPSSVSHSPPQSGASTRACIYILKEGAASFNGMLAEALAKTGGSIGLIKGMGVGRPLSVFNQSPEPEPWNTPPKQQTLRPNLNDTPSRDVTLAIKISTTTPFSHQKSRRIVFAWYLE
ncbi:hypothetical protein VTK26DRAFT_8612 [Humicola hyalothermophila]